MAFLRNGMQWKFKIQNGVNYNYNTKCDFLDFKVSETVAKMKNIELLSQCALPCGLKYKNNCNFFTLSKTGVCTLKRTKNKPSSTAVTSDANSHCGWIPSQFTTAGWINSLKNKMKNQ